MARRPRAVGIESPAELSRKLAVLEREMAVQRAAIEQLTQAPERSRDDAPDAGPAHAGVPRLHAIRP